MNIHEYQAKKILKTYGAPVLAGTLITDANDAVSAIQSLGSAPWVVKAQIHAGGRGKAGGVKLAKTPEEVQAISKELLGKILITPQTGPQGKVVQKLYIEAGCAIERELYISLLTDRATNKVCFIASTEGGMDIEEVAEHTPEKIMKITIDPVSGYQPFHGRKMAFQLGLEGDALKSFAKLAASLYKAFIATDAEMLEINPLVVTKDNQLMVLDCKMAFDDNAMFRHGDLEKLRDLNEEDPMETKAKEHELSYIKLDGTIGCMVNGAGLAMATLDIIQLHGGMPANFLDVGGGATREKVTAAFKLILSDPNVNAVLVNIFGGIMRCDIIADGIIHAAREVSLTIPLIVRLEGTNVELGKKMLQESGLTITSADDLTDAAMKAVSASKGA